ncbi:SDR family oxidoreductase [Levilactobacillus acidifarinae]|nr:SDR family oxidoreductase [Levilactobacillus acidifarinae]GEO70640.1 3-ketoacyl-ACP reductase [Levilactobacillus acidifarinae]
MDQLLANQVMLITGAGSAIGRKTASLLAQAGAKIVAADVPGLALTVTVNDLTTAGFTAIAVPTNVLNPAAVRALLTTTIHHFGRLDGLINHAGAMTPLISPETFGDKLWDQVTTTHTASVTTVTREVLPYFARQHHGVIVNVATVGQLTSDQTETAYTAAKRAITTLTKKLANRAATNGIRVNAITPGNIQADIVEPLRVRRAQEAGGLEVATRTSNEIAQTTLFLATNQASDVNGVIVSVDKGWTSSIRP